MARSIGAELLVWRNEPAIAAGTNPIALDTKRCCGLLKTQALLDALKHYNFDAAFGGARRDEEKSRAKERIYSFRDSAGQWDPKNQRPELWNLYNARIHPGESIRVFPLSNWTEMDVWQYIHEEKIPVVDLYFAKERPMYVRGDALLPIEQEFVARPGREAADGEVAAALAGMQPMHRGDSFRCGYDSEDHCGAAFVPLLGARQSRDRSRPGRLDGAEEAGGLLSNGALTAVRAFSVDDFSRRSARRICCASRLRAAWTMASRR
jgi:3'-phosphoadenosine 5'-phosphosulfate sulfotransferase (PAPS reductase)/FAD synthetase